MREFITVTENMISDGRALRDALEAWASGYVKNDAYTGSANAEEQAIIDLAAGHSCDYSGMLYRGIGLDDDQVQWLLAGKTLHLSPSARRIESWSKSEKIAYSFADDQQETNSSAVVIAVDSTRRRPVVDVDDFYEGSNEQEVITLAEPITLTMADIRHAWLYNDDTEQCDKVWPK